MLFDLQKKININNIHAIFNILIVVGIVIVVYTSPALGKFKHRAGSANVKFEIEQVREVFPNVARTEFIDTSHYYVFNANNINIGELIFSSPFSDNIIGYAGKTPLQISIDNSGKIFNVKLLKNSETPGFIEYIKKKEFLKNWDGLTISEALVKNVDAISGATLTSSAVVKSLKTCLSSIYPQMHNSLKKSFFETAKHALVLFVVALALICFFYSSRTKTLRKITLLLSIIIVGFWRNSALSLYIFYSWLTNGISVFMQISVFIIAFLAIVLPLIFGKSFYCSYLCPFGAMQEFVGKSCKRKLILPKTLTTILLIFRKIIILSIIFLLAIGVQFDLSQIEVFSVFSIMSASAYMLIFTVIIILISLFIPMPWCRFLCPTGTILDTVRTFSLKKIKNKK